MVWSVAASALALVSATAAVLLMAGAVVLASDTSATPWKLVLLPAVWLLPGVLVAVGRPANPLGWLMIAFAVGFGGLALSTEWVHSGQRAGAAWALWFADRASAVVVPIGLLVLMMLPDGRLPSPRWRPVAAVVVAVQTLVVLVWSLPQGRAAGPETDFPADVAGLANPVGVLPASVADALTGLDFWLLQVPLLLGPAAVVQRLRRRRASGASDDRERLVGVLGAAAVFAVFAVVGRGLWPSAADALDVTGSALLAAALCSAVFRRRLPGVEVVVHHALVYTTLTVAVALGYVVAVGALGQVGRSLSPLGVGIVTAAIALALLPLRTGLQRLVERAMYGDTRTPGRAVLRLAHAVADSTSLDTVMSGLARTVSASLRVPWVSIVVGDRRVDHGQRPPSATTRTATLASGDLVLGCLTVAYGPGRGFADRETTALAELVAHGARAVRAVQLADELLASRQQLVTAREEERSRLRRDLHDELGPTLAGLTMQLAGMEQLIRTDPVTAAQRVPRLETAARQALDDVRRVARELRPPALDELGLIGALRQVAEDVGVQLEVADAAELPPLSAAAEVAAYRIGAEALTNVARHTADHKARLVVTADAGQLLLTLVDHGGGSTAAGVAAGAGVGVLAMRERAEELGGTLRISRSPGGGTTVEARLPSPIADRAAR